jgi:hypothetical protein
MPIGTPLPASGDTSWYDWAGDVHSTVNALDEASGTANARPVFVQVASADASAAVKAGADYVCDGTADQVQINSALIDAAPLTSRNASSPAGAKQMGRVQLSGGRFNIAAPIEMHTGTALWGCGNLTELRAVSNNGTGIITLAYPSAHLVEVAHLYIYGNSSSGGSCNGIDFDMTSSGSTSTYPDTNPDSDHYIHSCYLDQFTGGAGRTAVRLWASGTANNRGNIIRDLQIRDCTGNGVELSAASDSFISGCHIGGTDIGYRIATGNTKISSCKSFYSNTYGLYMTSGRGLIAGFESQDDASGVYVTAGPVAMTSIIADTSSGFGIRVGASYISLSGFEVFVRGGGRYATQSVGLQFDSVNDCTVLGSVNPSNITTPISGSPTSPRSFARVPNGSSLFAVG